ncbi:MAG: hypothetical protein ACKO04_01585 [Actinomycetes bacterium]
MPIVHVTDHRCIPQDLDGFIGQWWYAVWDQPLPRSVLPQPGDSMFLADDQGVVRWETELLDVWAVPYEHAQAFVDAASRRYAVPVAVVHGDLPAPGFGVAWSAEPVRELALPTSLLDVELGDWTSTDDLPADLALLLGFPHDDDLA